MAQGLVARWNERRKLAKGRCEHCDAVLCDDATSTFCGADCSEAYQRKVAW